MILDDIIRFRRSHFPREFSGESVPDSLIHRMLENARWAPSHKLTMPWRFRVFAGEEKNALCAAMEQYYLQFTPAEKFDQKKLDKIRTYPVKVSHIISIGMHPGGAVPEWEELAATAMAVQNMWLTLTEEPNAAGYWTSGNGTGSDFMKQKTGLLADDKQLGFFLLGMVAQKRTHAERPHL
ncbi:MAG: nitroreductase [Bacteroidetes bacterium]|nr:nitroreductase [Bacteroidota bacterium]